MPWCCMDEQGKSGQVLFPSALRDGLEEPIAQAEPAPRFLFLRAVRLRAIGGRGFYRLWY